MNLEVYLILSPYLQVIMGGGRREFLPNSTNPLINSKGRRLDGVDLIEQWHHDKADRNVSHLYIADRDQLKKVFVLFYSLILSNFDHEK